MHINWRVFFKHDYSKHAIFSKVVTTLIFVDSAVYGRNQRILTDVSGIVCYALSKLIHSMHNYDRLLFGIERLNHCSISLNALNKSVTQSQLQSSITDVIHVLAASQTEAESLIRRLYYSLCNPVSPYVTSIKEVNAFIVPNM